MANRVIKDSIWTSPTLAKLSAFVQDQFIRWILMADDWGCFDANSCVIKGLAYPFRADVTLSHIEEVKEELYESGLLFLWKESDREWAFFVSWDSHHNFCNKTNVDNDGARKKNRRKTPEPPKKLLEGYLSGNKSFSCYLEQVGTSWNKMLSYSYSSSFSFNTNTPPNPPAGGRCGEKVFLENSVDGEQTVEAEKVTGRAKTRKRGELTEKQEADFERFWDAYPKKISKGQAKRTWKKLNPSEQLQGKILVTLERAKTSDQWSKEGGQFIPHAATWLNREGWEDVFESSGGSWLDEWAKRNEPEAAEVRYESR